MAAPVQLPFTTEAVTEVPVLVLKNGACATEVTVDFYDETKAGIKAAKAVCGSCPVASICLGYAIDNEDYGVWGGMTPAERAKLRTKKFVSQEDRQVAARLRERLDQGIKTIEIAAEFGVTERTIYRWKKRYELEIAKQSNQQIRKAA